MIKFVSENANTTVTVETENISWPELADHFLGFLLAAGYHVDRKDLENHFSE